MKVKIHNCGEGNAIIYKDMSKAKYNFLKEISNELVQRADAYAPVLFIREISDINGKVQQ